ncbi:hypothetical protein DFJ58DRAFT_792052, partial [Suillus subalutaceus]|uniref:uncharacterized protein n=1 Tax=Suillus subalutaceus TaxID=48586 RepID=UPI001B860D1C
MEPNSTAELRRWFTGTFYGGFIHLLVSFLCLHHHANSDSAITQNTIDADTTTVSCPFSLAIDVESLLGESSLVDLQSWSERQLICTLHWIFPNSSPIPDVLRHLPYLKSLLPADTLLTLAFRGPNVYGVTRNRQESWSVEWNKLIQMGHLVIRHLPCLFSPRMTLGDKYLRASTYLSTRAFPSTLLSRSPTLQITSSSYPFMLPGPVSWCTTYPEASTEARDDSVTISVIPHTTTPLGEEVFNNYGLKANDELILGCGFSLPQNPDVKITLRLGESCNKWAIGRHTSVRRLVAETPEEIGYEEDLEAAQLLLEMVQKKCDLLPDFPDEDDAGIGPVVRLMLKHYLEGHRERQEAAIEAARDEGIKLVFDDD